LSDTKYAYPLILNKVASPRYATPTLRRARLIDWLNGASTCRAAVIAADAGYGKTTLLFQWEREVPFPCYWYKLDRNDRDWTLHISYLAEAIAKHHPGFGRRAHSMLQQLGGPGSSRPGVAAYLLAEMHERLTEPCTFIIDDWHYVNAVTEVRGLWNQILRDAPATCRFVFASRVKPKLQFARFKTHGGYAELRTDDLRFTETEIAELFRDIYRDPLDPSEVAELERRTEGWAASLQLVEVSLRERSTPEERHRFIHSITATKDSDLFDFLAEEVLDQQPEETRNFLLSTSILQQITPEVAERLAGVHDGRRELTDLEQRGLFTNRLDEIRYRYHNLFREFLERRLIAERSDAEVVGLHIHAASYFETTEQWPEAIHHYLRAGLQRQAARLIAKYGEEVVAEGRLGLVDEWLQQLPEETIKQNARLSLLFGEACGIRGDWDRAIEALERARTYFARKGDRRLEALACLKLSSVYSNYGDPETSWRLAEEGLALAPADATAIRLRLDGDLALTGTWLTDGLQAVAAACRRIAVEATALGMEHHAAIALHNLGYVEHEMGRPAEAVIHLERAARFWADLPPNPFADFSDLVHALAAIGDFDRAARLAEDAIEKTRPWPRPNAEAHYGKALLLAIQGRFGDAAAALRGPLEAPESLGGGLTILGGLMLDCLYLGHGARSEVTAILDLVNQGPIDTRFRLAHTLSNVVGRHALGSCSGSCQAADHEIEHAEALGMVALAAKGRVQLASMAFDHKDRRAARKAVAATEAAEELGLWRSFRYWIRTLAPHAARLAASPRGGRLVIRLVEADPEGWRVPAIDALESLQGSDRADLLRAIVQSANRETAQSLARIPGADVSEAVRSLQVRHAARIYIRTLGTLGVSRGSADGPELTISKRRLRTMLGLLAAHAGRPLSRDQVIETLWPEADYSAGVNNLNQTVFQLRRELDPHHRDGDSPPYVVSTPDAVYLHPELVRTDLDDVRRLARRLADGHVGRRREAADDLLDLVRGEFLMDLRYEDWALAIQTRVHAEIRSLLHPLLLADGIEISHETGVRAACAVLALDEYDEVAQFALVRQLAAAGKRTAARAAAERYIGRLKSELDEEPPPELVDLMQALRRRESTPV
jgi:ATP/maltotriose-dependent transcriptional regulator MalT/DNA-binding SARP family transcriptional activator